MSNAASNLLYQEQEKLIVKRGQFEEELMTQKSNVSHLKPSKVKVRGAGKAGGFGNTSSSSKSNKKSAYKAEAKKHSKALLKDGLVRIDNVLTPDAADAVREYLYDLRQTAEEDIKAGTILPIQRFADVLLKSNRCDLTVPLGKDQDEKDIIANALNQVLRESAVGQTIGGILGDNAVLYELSCLMSDPGSQRQVLHPDTPFIDGRGPVLYTCFIALQDVEMDMGPTTWFPGTHTKEAHEAFMDAQSPSSSSAEAEIDSPKDNLMKNQPAVLGILPKGCCAIFDSRCLHCGTANKSKDGKSRALFYFSFKNPDVGYPGNPASIRSELGSAQITMQDIEADMELFGKGKGHPLIDRIGASMR